METNICNEKHSWALDNPIRKIFQPQNKILQKYIEPGMNIIDLGCGPGYFSIPMALKTGKNGKVTCVDIQEGMLNRIKHKIAGTQLEKRMIFHQCNDTGIGLKGSYDFVLAFWMIHEIQNTKKYFDEIFDLLKPNGKFLIVEPKGHVGKDAFVATIEKAKLFGFEIEEEPAINLSRAALLNKSYN